MSDEQRIRHFQELMKFIMNGIQQNMDDQAFFSLIRSADEVLNQPGNPINLSEIQIPVDNNNNLNTPLLDQIELLADSNRAEILKSAIQLWFQGGKVVLEQKPETFTQGMATDLRELNKNQQKDKKSQDTKSYIHEDNDDLLKLLSQEFADQDISNPKSTYAWKFASGQTNVEKGLEDGNEINLFFLGTSTPPLFSIHNIDVCETGHIICQAALQKSQQGKPTVLVKGIATADMSKEFPLTAITDPSIPGVSNSALQTIRKTRTTAKGGGADVRVQLAMENFFIPDLFKMILNKSLADRQELIINIAGHSRGGITTFIAADCINQFLEQIMKGRENEDYDIEALAKMCKLKPEEVRKAIADIKQHAEKLQIKLCALDPVEGARSMAQWSYPITFAEDRYIPKINIKLKGIKKTFACSYVAMPKRVKEALIFLANDERRSAFRPTLPTFDESTTVIFKRAHGKHGTLTGNFGNDGCNGQFQYKSFEGDQSFQDDILGIFDETLSLMNEFLSKKEELPPFPRNTIRRILRNPEYKNTKQLLLDLVETKGIDLNSLGEKSIIERIEKAMAQKPQTNIVFYESLCNEAQAAIEKHKARLLILKKEWRHDTNLGAKIDRDDWSLDRRLYIRGQKSSGTVRWHEYNLEEVARTRLPEAIFHGTVPIFTSSNTEQYKLCTQFLRLQSKMKFIAHSSLSESEKAAALFDKDFEDFIIDLNHYNTSENSAWVKEMISELMITCDYQYALSDPNWFLMRFEKFDDKQMLASMPTYCAQKQLTHLQAFFTKNGLNALSSEETDVLISLVTKLKRRLQPQSTSKKRKKTDISLKLEGSLIQEAQHYLINLKNKLKLKIKLDQYILAADVDAESSKYPQEIEKQRASLMEIRARLDKDDIVILNHALESLLASQRQLAQIESRKWIKTTSISGLKAAEAKVNAKEVEKEMQKMKEEEGTKIVKEDLEMYIKALEEQTSPRLLKNYTIRESTLALLESLKKLRGSAEPSEQIAAKLKKHIQDYIQNEPPGKFGYEHNSVMRLKEVQAKIATLRKEQALSRLGLKRKKLN